MKQGTVEEVEKETESNRNNICNIMNMEDDEDLIEKELQKDQKTQMRTCFAVLLMVVDIGIVIPK